MRIFSVTLVIFFTIGSLCASDALASQKFSIGCKASDIESHWHEGSIFIGKELDNFREEVSDNLFKNECSPEEFTSTAWCDLNDKWKLNEETYLIKTWCNSGTYNFNTAWFFQRENTIEPLKLLKPNFKWTYHQSDEQQIKSVRQVDFSPPTNILTGGSFDPVTLELQHFDFCCMGDISRNIKWVLREGVFVLIEYEADEIQNGDSKTQIKVNYD